MKQKFSVLDVSVVANELSNILTDKYIANVYSYKQQHFYFKLSTKDILFYETGAKMHLTSHYEMEINHFSKKLREHIKNFRIVKVYQYGFDRIIVFDLLKYKLVFEFFSLGNILLLDTEDNIIDLHRPIPQLEIAKGKKYFWNKIDISFSREHFNVLKEEFLNNLPFEKAYGEICLGEFLSLNLCQFKDIYANNLHEKFTIFIKNKIDQLKWTGELIKQKNVLADFISFSTQSANILKNEAVEKWENKQDNLSKEKFSLLDVELVKTLMNDKKADRIAFNSFNDALNAFYCLTKTKKGKQKSDAPKHEKIKKSQEKYIKELQKQTVAIEDIADKMETNRDFLKDILSIFNMVYEQKMNWNVFEHFYETEKAKGNKYALAIQSYDLKNKKAHVLLDEEHVELDLNLSLEKNIQKLYDSRKRIGMKETKTVLAMKNIQEKLKPKRESVKKQQREPYWFEKFHFTISENNVLILGGKNAQQNEQIVNKYMEDSDLYFHCDVKGASSVICKGNAERHITDATYMSLVMSKAWQEQVMKDVFYVNANQVSKTTPAGEFVPKGSFMIKGKKNTVYPYRLEYGVAVIFKLKGNTTEVNGLNFVNAIDDNSDVEHAMLITGAWTSLKKYSYAAKLVPGAEKKQKIAQTLVEKFDKMSIDKRENNMIRAIGLQEIIDILPGKCRLAKTK